MRWSATTELSCSEARFARILDVLNREDGQLWNDKGGE